MPAKSWKTGVVRIGLPLLVLAAGVGAGAVVINSKPPVAESTQGPVLRAVNSVVAEASNLAATVQGQGTVEPRQRITLVPQVSGTITWVAPGFVNGGRFQRGETILRIDASDHELAVTSAEAAVADAIQQLETARAQAEQAEADWALLGRPAPSALALRKPQLAGAQARLLSTQAELQRARLMLARTEIVAPFTGILTDKQVDFGQYLGAGTQIGQLAASDVLEVRLALPERELANLDLASLAGGAAAMPLVATALSGTTESRWQGRLVRSEGLIDPQTRNLTVVAQFAGDELLADDGTPLTIGQFVRAAIAGRSYEAVFRLPRTALHRGGSVFVVDGEHKLRERQVEVLEFHPEHILVASGLAQGERVNISPLSGSVEGLQVRIADPVQASGSAAGIVAAGVVP